MRLRTRRRTKCHSSQTTLSRFTASFFFNDTATTEIYTLSLHDALPICHDLRRTERLGLREKRGRGRVDAAALDRRSEEHTSELQSRLHLVCRLLLEKKNGQGYPRRQCERAGHDEDVGVVSCVGPLRLLV